MKVIMFLSCYRLLLFVDEADAFLRKRSTVSLHVFHFPEALDVFVTKYIFLPFQCSSTSL